MRACCGYSPHLLACLLTAESASVYLRRIKQLAPPEDPEERLPIIDMRVKVRHQVVGLLVLASLLVALTCLQAGMHCSQYVYLQRDTVLR